MTTEAPDPSAKRFFMNGDEWGLYEVLPSENAPQCRQIADEAHLHHKDTEFGPHGWSTPPYVIPPPNVPISVRNIRVADLDSLFAGVLQKAAAVDSCVDFTGAPFHCPNSFAYALSFERYWQSEGFYGDQKEAIVQSLYLAPMSVPQERHAALVDAVVQLGRRFDLVLRANADGAVDLRNPEAVAAYFPTYDEPRRGAGP
jgi:hypothetical protein